jgi:hypothetical protein
MARNCNPLPAKWAGARLRYRQSRARGACSGLARFLSVQVAIHGGSGIR